MSYQVGKDREGDEMLREGSKKSVRPKVGDLVRIPAFRNNKVGVLVECCPTRTKSKVIWNDGTVEVLFSATRWMRVI